MNIQKQTTEYKYKSGIHLVLALVLFVSMGLGCARTHETTKTETTVTTYEDPGQVVLNNNGYIIRQQDEAVSEKSETTTTTTSTTEASDEHPGILSSTLHAVGYVIALPFLIIGSVFHMIFGG